ncbi:MAG: GIY-YIG nuclease family protein [Candidatus Curtissbacteria bacterium]|nr:GIY-YIG nuclease family protein [Candidatus Curtissbacteria bacterium]
MYFTYVLKSKTDGNLYTGWTDNLEKRVKAHNQELVVSTKNRVPLILIYYEACLSKEKAI